MLQNSNASSLLKQVIDIHKNDKFLTEETIYWELINLGQKQTMFLKVINVLVEIGYVKVIYNSEEVDEYGDGYVYSPLENQECNENEEWAWILK